MLIKQDYEKYIKRLIESEERILPNIRYNNKLALKVLIVYPDYYQYGLPNLGHQMLYKEAIDHKNVFVDRFYLPKEEYLNNFQEKKLSLISWENHINIKDFDLILFSISFESQYSNILKILDFCNIPLYSNKRREGYPLIIGGGHCVTYNPEPLANFFDCFVIGDGEEVIHDIFRCYIKNKRNNLNKENCLKELSRLNGLYIPSFYISKYGEDGSLLKWTKLHENIPEKIKRIHVNDINNNPASSKFITKYTIYKKPTFTIEVTRGCKMNCRFCMMAHILRPQRQLTLENIINQIKFGMKYTNLIKLFFESLPKNEIDELFTAIEPLIGEGLQIRMGSLRAEYLSEIPIKMLSKMKQNIIILAPETINGKLRNSINKGIISDLDIFNVLKMASKYGIENFGLYLLIGLPNESKNDIEELAYFIRDIRLSMNKNNMKGILEIHLNPLFPKPFTPFQWMRMIHMKTAKKNIMKIISLLESNNINVIYNPIKKIVVGIENQKRNESNNIVVIKSITHSKIALIQPILSRGDRRVSEIIYSAYTKGDSIEAWQNALRNSTVPINIYMEEKPLTYRYPWDFIDHGIDRNYLENEWKRARKGLLSPMCFNGCTRCNICCNKTKVEEKCQKKIKAS